MGFQLATVFFTDGFDLVDPYGAKIKYNGYIDGVNNIEFVAGKGGGKAIVSNNSGFSDNGALFSVRLPSQQSTLGVHIDYQQQAGAVGEFTWYLISLGQTPILQLRQINGSGYEGCFQVLGPGGALIATTSIATTPGAWTNIVLQVTFGASGSVSLYFNGAPALTDQPVPYNFAPYNQCDRAAWQWSAGFPPGILLDNYFIYDGAQYCGPCHVDSTLPDVDSPQTAWTPGATPPDNPGQYCYQMVDDTPASNLFGLAPDGDYSFITPGSADQLFGLDATQCYGLILGVGFNVCARLTGSSPADVNIVAQLTGGEIVLGSQTVAAPTYTWGASGQALPIQLTGYQTYQTCLALSPATNTNWVDGELSNGVFGVGDVINTSIRVTAFNVEKITSLSAFSFDCGSGSSYAY